MAHRPLLMIPLVALFTAATAACGGSSAGTTAVPATTSAPTAAPVAAHTTARPVVATTTKTVTVTATRSTAPQPTTTSTAQPASAPSFASFAGEWVGHTRFVAVSKTGRLEEHLGDGCCDPMIDLVLQLSNPHRAGSRWVATSRVVSAKVHAGWKATGQPAPKPGDPGTVTIGADHILVDSITGNGYCDPDTTAPGTCGA